ncbi:penicillin-binding protein 2 [Leptospira borgpetersenii]|uniref:Penicillin-binding protein 2 n=1 Tax=Leptospira borgpetersenii serovar Pomona str. 200901868 TaxID=1192866 RepID=M6VXX2_LEPBO|nr:penicillin-binding protein 2 [Leptospira borgpetersenii]EMO62352.1 penicillin-binding protein 2 [Leptospira borgpetersenii serovar Pomona str. 200901868]MBE8398884.1 penicillin-binding protein 2 [Leptospira borgpetersenii serovar Tarassovi]MBE8402017.1 penicillin-binding protein 2 [Leptospira borgpetersenii serovar Tarassovi]MBE8405004.1 penicillin-binding protein 2 [Leptospira borgpetersenii serovar Tarassovi]MBE8411314.1 penicillin-binding protein 2 [Leptospira borgpetersenii serovar Tara
MFGGAQSASEYRLEKSFRLRLYIFSGLVVFTLAAFIFQLFNLQILNGTSNALKAEKFVRKSETMPAARGQMFDRNFLTPETSMALVSNYSSLDAILNTSLFKYDPASVKAFIQEFARTLSIPISYYENELIEPRFSRNLKAKKPIVLLEGITHAQQERISAFDNISKYIILLPSPRRIYKMGPALAHVTGYIGKPTREDLLSGEIKSYQYLGKSGLELEYDSELRGVDGFRIQKRSSEGNIEEERVVEHSSPGNNLILTIDKDIQIAAHKALKGSRGTAIAIKVSTGEILAMASNPSYDPNILSGKNKADRTLHFKRVKDNGGFLNLAIQSKFPPASTYKTLVALAALESQHKIGYTPETTFSCNGSFVLKSTFAGVPDQVFNCWEKGGHGINDLAHALQKSCSVYFYNLGYKLGSDAILNYSRLFGLEDKSKVDLPGEITGFVPSSAWKKRTYGTKWFDGDTINLSIGQGFISTTPMGMALFYMGLLNRGQIYQPYVVSEIRDPVDNSIINRTTPQILRDIPINQSSAEAIKEGLKLVIKSGTAAYVLNKPFLPDIAGKTGTAQTRRRGSSGSNHAWFVGYAPANAPVSEQVLVVVFVEYGVGGAAGAAPVAREMFHAAFPPGTFKKSQDITPSSPSTGQEGTFEAR